MPQFRKRNSHKNQKSNGSNRTMAKIRAERTFRGIFYPAALYILKSFHKGDKHAKHKGMIKAILGHHKARYGYRIITMELKNNGICCNHKIVLKLMKEMHLHCKIRRKKHNSFHGETNKAAENLIQRNFYAGKPNEK